MLSRRHEITLPFGCGARTHACRVHNPVNAGPLAWRTIDAACGTWQSDISPLKCLGQKKLVTCALLACRVATPGGAGSLHNEKMSRRVSTRQARVHQCRMFDCRVPHAALSSKASVHRSVNAARMSACATMVSITYTTSGKLSDIAHECLRHMTTAKVNRLPSERS
jgi:hypothetical protein